MSYKHPPFKMPDFEAENFKIAKDITVAPVEKDGIAPDKFYLTSHLPTFYKINGTWVLPDRSSLNCVAVIEGETIKITELRDLKVGQQVVISPTDNPLADGIYLEDSPFDESVWIEDLAVETSFTDDYELLFELMKREKESGGNIVWVLGPAVVFDHDTRIALSELANAGYVHALLAGNAMATHDLEGGYLDTALGQNIYTQESVPMGHYNHLDLLNEVRRHGSIKASIDDGIIRNGFMKEITKLGIPFVLAGSIRDDGPLPEVYQTSTESLTAMKKITDKATLVICLATMLHSITTANLVSSYRKDKDGNIVPIYLYSIDVTENATHKVAATREYVAVKTIITNVQDFVVNIQKSLLK